MKKTLTILSLLLSLTCSAQVQMIVSGFDQPPAGFTPGNVDSLFYWYAADNGVLDSVGSPATNFQGVGTWNDLSGNGHHVTQGTDGARPSYLTTGGPNGYPALYFDGTDDFLASAAHWWESDDLTVFLVMRFANATRDASEFIVNRLTTTTNRQWDMSGGEEISNYRFLSRQFRTGDVTDVRNTRFNNFKHATYKVHSYVHNGATTSTLQTNGVNQVLTSSEGGTGDGTIYNSSGKVSIGGAFPDGTPTAFLNGYISEIIVYSRALTATERSNIEKYLNNKYKLY
jgi:hypothetical protein